MLYPIGLQSFEKIRKEGFVYVDKTAKIFDIVKNGGYYFLSRPRRFGKSLLVSTMEAYFKGRKELFDGLAIADMEKDWKVYPVLHIDLSGKSYDNKDVLRKVLDDYLFRWEDEFGSVNRSDVPGVRFGNIINAAYAKTGRQVVILIDEYDKPIVDNLGDEPLVEAFRKELQGFYSVMKSKDAYIRLGFLTGVTKIGQMSVFSALNNIEDISLNPAYSDICGISNEELRSVFGESVTALAAANKISVDECYSRLEMMYDGYHFAMDVDGVYNPFSLLQTFKSKFFKKYWFETGTPTFLVKLMQETSYDIRRLSDDEVGSSLLTDVNTVRMNPVPLLYQSGYLTIKGYNSEFDLYRLGFPNLEVKDGFLNFLLNYYAPIESESTNSLISRMTRDIRSGKPEEFMKRLEALFARTPYQIQGDSEKDFQYAIYIILELMGEYVEVERQTSNGRIDVLIKTKDYIYIIEIKINDTAEAALKQIEEKGYARPFKDDPRKIFRIGVRFSTSSRCIDQWKVE